MSSLPPRPATPFAHPVVNNPTHPDSSSNFRRTASAACALAASIGLAWFAGRVRCPGRFDHESGRLPEAHRASGRRRHEADHAERQRPRCRVPGAHHSRDLQCRILVQARPDRGPVPRRIRRGREASCGCTKAMGREV